MKRIRLGTRGSKMALMQAELVKRLLQNAHGDALQVEIVIIKTSGDWKPKDGEVALSDAQGGKGQFLKEIEQAILSNDVDCGVHCIKDMPADLPQGLVLSQVMKRDNPFDALLVRPDLNGVQSIADLPQNSVVGTSSKRRGMMTLAQRPDLKVEILRGNADTRLKKLHDGQVDATFLSICGLERLGLEGRIAARLDETQMLPCAGQGGLGFEVRAADHETIALLAPLNDVETLLAVTVERTVLSAIGASCHTPIGIYARRQDDGASTDPMHFQAVLGLENGTKLYHVDESATVEDMAQARDFGLKMATKLLSNVPDDIQSEIGVGLLHVA